MRSFCEGPSNLVETEWCVHQSERTLPVTCLRAPGSLYRWPPTSNGASALFQSGFLISTGRISGPSPKSQPKRMGARCSHSYKVTHVNFYSGVSEVAFRCAKETVAAGASRFGRTLPLD